ncbi:glycosyltransferase [Croceivirga thetidis]|uniref:Glycosyltransferase family 4 protein n=1 Tax=Croceivirga thetidis TaxID=2721623 RepID=A0ABX1GQ61_9FLAO|nr:glycosyltransferase [Croceivirga thetidis]NKI32045.1 glycosyltransferase family 4 protein [Croceivirga thetidis]
MSSKKKILVVAKDQFGYSTTLFKHCQYLQNKFDVCYLGWDYQRPEIKMTGIEIKHVSRLGNKVRRTLRLINAIKAELSKCHLAFGTYFLGISLLKILISGKRYILYIDTLHVEHGGLKKLVSDSILRFELFFFSEVMVISRGVAQRIGFKNYQILPLGGESFKINFEKQDEKLSLLYVGTLGRRKIMECVQGYHKFLSSKKDEHKYIFRIVGDSDTGEQEEIDAYIQQNNLGNNIKMYGYVPQHELYTIYDKSNLGISFIPLFEEYDKQPPTKTYEYLVSGLPIIATATTANKEIVTKKDGLLINDSSEDFCTALEKMCGTIDSYNSNDIQKRNERYKWKYVVERNLIPVLTDTKKELA